MLPANWKNAKLVLLLEQMENAANGRCHDKPKRTGKRKSFYPRAWPHYSGCQHRKPAPALYGFGNRHCPRRRSKICTRQPARSHPRFNVHSYVVLPCTQRRKSSGRRRHSEPIAYTACPAKRRYTADSCRCQRTIHRRKCKTLQSILDIDQVVQTHDAGNNPTRNCSIFSRPTDTDVR